MKLGKFLAVSGMVLTMMIASARNVQADEVTDAAILLQQQQLLAQQAEQAQQALLIQQAQQAALAQLVQQQQAIMLAQYQAGLMAQYQAALEAQQAMAKIKENGFQQTFLLNSIQTMQRAQYENMINTEKLDYKPMLLEEYTKAQKNGLNSFAGYTGW